MFPNLNGIRGMYPEKKLIHILQYASIKGQIKVYDSKLRLKVSYTCNKITYSEIMHGHAFFNFLNMHSQ